MSRIRRNAPCPCSSGRKYKRCCLRNVQRKRNPWDGGSGSALGDTLVSLSIGLELEEMTSLEAEPPYEPELVIVEPTTHVYRVLDEEALHRALDGEPDVIDDGDGGWLRLRDPLVLGGGHLLSIEQGEQPDEIEVFARSRELATRGRLWLRRLAGGALEFLRGEIQSPLVPESDVEDSSDAEGLAGAPMPPALQRYHEKVFFKPWLIDPHPGLGGLTPREAAATEDGRQRLRALLEDMQDFQVKASQELDCAVLDYGFLWKKLGLDPEPEPALAAS